MLVYMDGPGIRPAALELGERLATYGYFVLLPDLCYRAAQDADGEILRARRVLPSKELDLIMSLFADDAVHSHFP